MIRHFILVYCTALLLACASQVPVAIRAAAPGDLNPSQIHNQPDVYIGQPIRWGGTIIQITNLAEETRLMILAQPLDKQGRPLENDAPQGRFIATIAGFLEPVLYANGREITVRGSLVSTTTEKVDAFPYLYPVVRVDTHYLWEPRPQYEEQPPSPYWYDPWYPFHPYWGYPYYW